MSYFLPRFNEPMSISPTYQPIVGSYTVSTALRLAPPSRWRLADITCGVRGGYGGGDGGGGGGGGLCTTFVSVVRELALAVILNSPRAAQRQRHPAFRFPSFSNTRR